MDSIRNAGINKTHEAHRGEGILKKGVGKVTDGIQTSLDEFVGSKATRVDINTNSPEYKNISTDEAARMIGYFTQKMEAQGFPWKIYTTDKGILGNIKEIGDFQALQDLEKGKPVIFRPRRVIGLGFNPPRFKGKDVAGNESTGKVEVKQGGMEIKFGVPVEIKDKKDLKLLYELYNPDIKIDDVKGKGIKAAARELAYFTKGAMTGQYPWKMYKNEGFLQKVGRMAKSAIKRGIFGAAIGGAIASLFSVPAMLLGASAAGPVGVMIGMGATGGAAALSGVIANRKGKEINAFEALSRLNEGKPVKFQEKKKREIGLSIPFPIGIQLGSISFYGDHGEASEIKDLKELNLFHKIQEQAQEQKPK